jgi:hypothetical protein
MRLAERLLPEDEPDSAVESEQLTEPPRLNEILIEQENNSYFFSPSSRISEPFSTGFFDRNNLSKLTIDHHNSTCSTMKQFKVTPLVETRRTGMECRIPKDGERSERKSLLGPVPQIKISLPWE